MYIKAGSCPDTTLDLQNIIICRDDNCLKVCLLQKRLSRFHMVEAYQS